jgi:hypothetical protein
MSTKNFQALVRSRISATRPTQTQIVPILSPRKICVAGSPERTLKALKRIVTDIQSSMLLILLPPIRAYQLRKICLKKWGGILEVNQDSSPCPSRRRLGVARCSLPCGLRPARVPSLAHSSPADSSARDYDPTRDPQSSASTVWRLTVSKWSHSGTGIPFGNSGVVVFGSLLR